MEPAIGDGKNRVAEALWRVVARDGMTGVSVRTVAADWLALPAELSNTTSPRVPR